jgi:hypothetical protein
MTQEENNENTIGEKLMTETEMFIERNRKICWEAEYQGGEFCIGEESIREFIEKFIGKYPLTFRMKQKHQTSE